MEIQTVRNLNKNIGPIFFFSFAWLWFVICKLFGIDVNELSPLSWFRWIEAEEWASTDRPLNVPVLEFSAQTKD